MNENIITNNKEKCALALQGLYNVFDPEIGLNVVDLGLIYQLDFDEAEKSIFAQMTLTTQFCPMGESITGDVSRSLAKSFPLWSVHVELTFDPHWDHSKISAAGKQFLGQ